MRKIKFRAWNKQTKNIYRCTSIYDDGSCRIQDDSTNKHIEANNVILLQYTGLKDKNGVEIFEGDYLLDGHSGRYAEVKFIKGAFVVVFDDEIQDLYDWTCECVIGNIYKNPELLN